MVDKARLTKYLDAIETYLRQLKELRQYPLNDFLSDWKIYDLVDRKLHLTLESFLTIGEMLIGEFSFRKPDTYADIPRILHENKVIGGTLKDSLVDLARFRNVLVHDYLYLNHEIVYTRLQKIPAIIEEFIEAVKSFVVDR